ncbi:ClpX C4-type zinc finger protein [Nonomuraea sp. NPDC051941]|uniref:ClpX C4-type zinc finger protein n=1 Tax=Nonomuraea sp. NPDC051941 TaxID=3364373 RepID=UPI0037CCBBA7
MTTRKSGSQKGVRFCDFCGKSQKEVFKVIEEEKKDSHICNECVDLCAEIIEEETSFSLGITEAPSHSYYNIPADMTEDDKFFWTMG